MQIVIYAIGTLVSAMLLYASTRHLVPIDPAEAWGFVTGAWCVWLTVKENIWNWPIGIANDIFFIVLFWHARLYADMSLQVIYVILGFLGWYWWLYGGQNHTVLHVNRTPRMLAILTALIVAIATAGMTIFLQHVHDSAPFWDAITTTLSLAAQFLLTKKLFENWHVWITADVIYIALYAYKHLYLTSALYALFLIMCLVGLRDWRRSMERSREATPELVRTYG